jgi:hypothetical protein
MLHEYFEKEEEQVYDGVGVVEEIILRELFSSDQIGLFANTPLKILQFYVVAHYNHVSYENVEELLFNLGVYQDFIGNMG